jgi:hypothetical protein
MNQCRDASVCPANALPGSDYCAQHTGKPSRAEVEAQHEAAAEAAYPPPTPWGRFYLPPQSFDVQSLLTFRVASEFYPHHGGEGERVLVGETQKPFMPKGLMLWNVGDLQVAAALIGTNLQLLCSFGKVPARWWSTQQSFDDVVRALAEGKEAASWGTWGTVHPGVLVRLQFDGDASAVRAVMWGLST